MLVDLRLLDDGVARTMFAYTPLRVWAAAKPWVLDIRRSGYGQFSSGLPKLKLVRNSESDTRARPLRPELGPARYTPAADAQRTYVSVRSSALAGAVVVRHLVRQPAAFSNQTVGL